MTLTRNGGLDGGGVSDWVDLSETPGAIAPNQIVQGTSAGDALEFVPSSSFVEGIKYAWSNAADRLAQTNMVEAELGVQRDTGDVYRWDGASWSVFFNLNDGSTVGAPFMLSGIGNPNSVVAGLFGQEYFDTVTGLSYVQIVNPSGSIWILN